MNIPFPIDSYNREQKRLGEMPACNGYYAHNKFHIRKFFKDKLRENSEFTTTIWERGVIEQYKMFA